MLPKPKYCICKKCLAEGNLFIAFVCEHREQHMESAHDLAGHALKEMILKPKLHFISIQEAVDILGEALRVRSEN